MGYCAIMKIIDGKFKLTKDLDKLPQIGCTAKLNNDTAILNFFLANMYV